MFFSSGSGMTTLVFKSDYDRRMQYATVLRCGIDVGLGFHELANCSCKF